MEKKNRAGRRNLFKCFKPTVDDDDFPFDCLFPSHLPTPKRRLGRSFSGSFMSAFSKTSLVKRLRSKKAKKDSSRSSSSTDSSPSRSENVAKTKRLLMGSEEIMRSSSAPSLLFSSSPTAVMTSSSRSSSISSNSRSDSLNLKQTNLPYRQQMLTGRESGKYSICTHNPGTMTGGMVSFMICLLCVVVWGKVFAILACTSTWFYFFHTRMHLSDSDSVVNSDEYRKKVILQGLLERHCSYNMRT